MAKPVTPADVQAVLRGVAQVATAAVPESQRALRHTYGYSVLKEVAKALQAAAQARSETNDRKYEATFADVHPPPPGPVVQQQPPSVAASGALEPPPSIHEAEPSSSFPTAPGPSSIHLQVETSRPTAGATEPSLPDSVVQPPQSVPDSPPSQATDNPQPLKSKRQQRPVPSSRIGRVFGFGSLGVGLGLGAIGELGRRTVGAGSDAGSLFLTEANMDRLVSTMCRMRGAALKIGQIVSIQDNSFLPPIVAEMFDRVRDSADYMPTPQMQSVLVKELGPEWRQHFSEFDETPFASASIGQVHRGLRQDGDEVALKIQYPGVADSINSDIDNLNMVLKLTGLFPKGLYMENVLNSARTELGWECDYEREAECARRFSRLLLKDNDGFVVPKIYPEITTKRVLGMEMLSGEPLGHLGDLSQDVRNNIAARILRLSLREVFEFRFMQTDPNFSNFLYDRSTDQIALLDFGASREFEDRFVEHYMGIIYSAMSGDFQGCVDESIELGFLTGTENPAMAQAHVQAVTTLASPFAADGEFDFATQDVSSEVRALIPTMLQHRVAPPPQETYSLHRKMSGAFLLCTKLGASIACKPIFEEVHSAFEARDWGTHSSL